MTTHTPNTVMSHDIPLNLIDADPNQPRKHFDAMAIDELAQSIEANGLAVPILVRPAGERFVIVHGERRYRAATLLGWETIPANVRDIDPDAASWLALVENVQRADLSPVEEAIAYQERIAQGMTQTELAKRIGKTQSYIAQKLRLLKLPDPVRFYLDQKAISEGHARQLLRLRDIYGGDMRAKIDASGTDELPDEILILTTTVCVRPMDRLFGAYPEGSELALHAQAARILCDYVTKHNGLPPAWVLTAYWFAWIAASLNLSVVHLDQFIDRWRDTIYSAVFHTHGQTRSPHGDPESDEDHARKIEWFAYKSDLRHARLDGWSKSDRAFYERAIMWVAENGLVPPSLWWPAEEHPDEELAWAIGDYNALGKALKKRLDEAKTLQDYKSVADDAAKVQHAAAADTLRAQRAAGLLLQEVQP